MIPPQRPAPPSATHTAIDTRSLEAAYDNFAARGIGEFSADQKTAIIAMHRQLTEGFDLDKTFYDDTAALLHALGIAHLSLQHPADTVIYRNELYLLCQTYLKTVPAGIDDKTFTSTADAKTLLAALEKYKDAALTTQVEKSGVLTTDVATAVKNLKLRGTDQLAPYKIIAFDFNSSDSRFVDFTKIYPLYGASPMMWVTELNGTNYIVMLKEYAEAVIAGTKNSLLHELIHTQKAFNRGESGRIIEERRAEMFSGDTSAYYEAKQALIYIQVFSDIDLNALLEKYPTDAISFFTAAYREFGITGMNALVFSWPNAFLGEPYGALKIVDQSQGLDRAIQESIRIGRKNPSAMHARIRQRYDKLMKIFGTRQRLAEDLQNNLADAYRMPTAAKIMTNDISSP